MKQLHIISTGQQTVPEFIHIISLIHPYIDFIHLRERNWTAQTYIDCIDQLLDIGVPLEKILINDRVDIAVITGVYGVQLPTHSLPVKDVKKYFPSLQIGCSVHSVEKAIEQEKAGANMLLYGHIFSSRSKAGLPPRGISQLKNIVKQVTIPVIAIGGITPRNVQDVCESGANGIAVLSGVLLAQHPLHAVLEYREKLHLFKGER